MKKKLLQGLVIACIASTATVSFAQRPHSGQIATPKQRSERAAWIPDHLQSEPLPTHRPNTHLQGPGPNGITTGKVAAIVAVPLGSAGNVLTCLRGEQNQVVAVDSLDIVAFVHRNNPSTFGGTSGGLRYDVSIDGGTSFSSDIGYLNSTQTYVARYPNITSGNWATGSNPLNSEFVYAASALNAGATSFDGFVYGASDVVTTPPPTSTEHYLGQGIGGMLPGGLCQSARGVYWFTDISGNGTASVGDVHIYKGAWDNNLQDVNFVRHDTIATNPSLTFNGAPHQVGSNIAFSPDGQYGWVAWLGDMVGGRDSVFAPNLAKTTDCGDTWSTAIEVDLDQIPWIKDSLQSLWIDSLGNPASDGHASCSFDFDLTVDSEGNPHFVTVICSGADYSVSSGLAKFLGDVTTTDGGATWSVDYISPVLTFRTQVFGATSTTVTMDNQPQVARDEGGCNIFYLWADSDTSLVGGNMNGLGFGESANLAPNLRVAAKNIATGRQTYPKLVTDGDLIWEGSILFPALAPIVTSDASGWELPVVVVVMGGSNEPIDPANFFYLGNDVRIENTGWCDPTTMDLGWVSFGYSAFVSPCTNPAVAFCTSVAPSTCAPVAVSNPLESGITLADAYPNPTSGQAVIGVNLPAATELALTLHNSIGQRVAVVAEGGFNAGTHSFKVETSRLPAGVYFYQLTTDGSSLQKKLVVTH